MSDPILMETAAHGLELLQAHDPALHALLGREQRRQADTLTLVASCSLADPSVLACAGSAAANTTTEGYPGARFHAGCAVVDQVEALAVERARAAFGARHANVQPHSGTSANQAVMFALLRPGDALLGMDLDAGGHLSHGARASVSGRYFRAAAYGTGDDGRLDYDAVRRAALAHRPRLIVAGASAYPRAVDWARFRQIADEAGALLLADISHVAGLVAAGEHPSPIDHAHVTTTSTYKQLCGPRGGLILLGRDADSPAPGGTETLAQLVQRAVFPFFQGTPDLAGVAAKARALAAVTTPGFRALARRIVHNARALAGALQARGWRVVTGGTDTHMVLVDVGARGVTGAAAERALEACGIVVNRNRIAGDRRPARVGSGVRLGTNVLSQRGMGPAEMQVCAALFDEVLGALDASGAVDPRVAERTRDTVRGLCSAFPIPRYPRPENGAGASVAGLGAAALERLVRPERVAAP
jgi:glycine hydroxymethyltransferase